jgi:hypothetical protein
VNTSNAKAADIEALITMYEKVKEHQVWFADEFCMVNKGNMKT